MRQFCGTEVSCNRLFDQELGGKVVQDRVEGPSFDPGCFGQLLHREAAIGLSCQGFENALTLRNARENELERLEQVREWSSDTDETVNCWRVAYRVC